MNNLLLRPTRGFLGLALRDVETATGVPANRLSKAEHGSLRLNFVEERALQAFYTVRLRMFLQDAGRTPDALEGTEVTN